MDGMYIARHPSEKRPHKKDHKRDGSKQDDIVIALKPNPIKQHRLRRMYHHGVISGRMDGWDWVGRLGGGKYRALCGAM